MMMMVVMGLPGLTGDRGLRILLQIGKGGLRAAHVAAAQGLAERTQIALHAALRRLRRLHRLCAAAGLLNFLQIALERGERLLRAGEVAAGERLRERGIILFRLFERAGLTGLRITVVCGRYGTDGHRSLQWWVDLCPLLRERRHSVAGDDAFLSAKLRGNRRPAYKLLHSAAWMLAPFWRIRR